MTKTKLFLVLIAAISIFMRFFHLSALFHFTMDEEYWMYIPFNIATGYHFPLIGGSIADTGLYTSPWFVYIMSLVAFVGRGDPLVFGVVVSLLGVITTILVYVLGRKLFDQKVALVASLFYASSTLVALWDRHYWNASLTPFLSLVCLYFVYRIISGEKRYFLFLGLVLSLAVSAHGTGLALVLFTAISLFWFRNKIKFKNRNFFLGLTIFCLSFLPVVLFDLRHNFLEIRALTSYVSPIGRASEPFSTRAVKVGQYFVETGSKLFAYRGEDVASELTIGDKAYSSGPSHPLGQALFWLTVLFCAYRFRLRKITEGEILSTTMIGSTLFGLLIFHSQISAYYFSPIAIPIFFLASKLIVTLVQGSKTIKIGFAILVMALVIFNLEKMAILYHSSSYDAKMGTVRKVLELSSHQPFNFYVYCSGRCTIYGYRYLFTYLGQEPTESYMDGHFSWLYQKRLTNVKALNRISVYLNDTKQTITVENLK